MNLRHNIKLFVLILFYQSSYLSATDLSSNWLHINELIEHVSENKIYLNGDKLQIINQSAYFENHSNEQIFKLTPIYEDYQGIYIKTGSRREPTAFWICMNHNCASRYYYPPTKCERCGGRDFIVRYH